MIYKTKLPSSGPAHTHTQYGNKQQLQQIILQQIISTNIYYYTHNGENVK